MRGEMSLRIAYNLFTQKPKTEREDFARWIKMTAPGKGDDFLRCNGAGEMLVFSAADFEDFLEPRPDLLPSLEDELKSVVALLAANKWPFRLHATYDESVTRFLNVFEAVNRDIPLGGLHWFFDHCETISERSLDRVKALGGGIAIQHRMAYQGEYFIERYGNDAAQRTPPIPKDAGAGNSGRCRYRRDSRGELQPVGLATGLITGRQLAEPHSIPKPIAQSRAKRFGSTPKVVVGSQGSGLKGTIALGQFADVVALSEDYFSVADEADKNIQSVLTIVDGKVVHATEEFSKHAPPPIPVLPEWSPVARFTLGAPLHTHIYCIRAPVRRHVHAPESGLWGMGCECFTF